MKSYLRNNGNFSPASAQRMSEHVDKIPARAHGRIADELDLRNPVVNMRWFHVVVVILILVFGYIHAKSSKRNGCYGRPRNDTEVNQPLYLRNTSSQYSFMIPVNGTLYLQENEPILLVCPNQRNKLLNSNKNVSSSLCSEGKFKVEDRPYDFNELQCNKSIRGDVMATNKRCGNNEGYLTNIGYYIGRKDFLTLIEICYDPDRGNALYAEHTVYGESIRHASRSKKRPSFNPEGVGKDIGAAVAYKNAFQKSTFNKLLGSAVLAEKYINRKSYLSRGHLAPDADFLFAAWQFSTYFYINACPQWQVINGGNWEKIESMIRKRSGNRRETFRVITGTHGVLSLADFNGTSREMYLLSNGRLRVPKYTWKVVYSISKEEAVVLIALNNPFAGNTTANSYLCKSICKTYSWYRNTWDQPEKGLVHCCEYQEFIKRVRTVPILNVRNVLRGT